MEKPHYYYKTQADTRVGLLLQEYMTRCADASEQARAWAEAQGADSYFESPYGMAGGIVSVEFKHTISKDGWQRIVTRNPDGVDVYFVPDPDSELEKEMFALPIVSEFGLVAILKFRPVVSKKSGKPRPFSFGSSTPVIFLAHGYWYVDVPYECMEQSLVRVDQAEFNEWLHRMSND